MAPSLPYKAESWSLAAKCWFLSGALGNQLFPIRLGSSWPSFPKLAQPYSIRLGLGGWLQNAALYQEPLEINFFNSGLEGPGQFFQNSSKPIL